MSEETIVIHLTKTLEETATIRLKKSDWNKIKDDPSEHLDTIISEMYEYDLIIEEFVDCEGSEVHYDWSNVSFI